MELAYLKLFSILLASEKINFISTSSLQHLEHLQSLVIIVTYPLTVESIMASRMPDWGILRTLCISFSHFRAVAVKPFDKLTKTKLTPPHLFKTLCAI